METSEKYKIEKIKSTSKSTFLSFKREVQKMPSSKHPILYKLKSLGKKTVEDVFVYFVDSSSNSLLSQWIKFARENAQIADEYCSEIRKEGDTAAIVSYFLSKELYNLSAGKRINVFAWSALKAVKVLKDISFKTKVSYRDKIITIIKELCSLLIEPKTDFDRVLIDQIRHYKIIYLASENHLSDAFERCRSRYLENPQDIDNLRQLGWTLHDCIIQSAEGLADKKLVEFFANELSHLKYPDEMQTRDPKLVRCYASDIQKAKEFLDGTGELRSLLRNNELSAALVLADRLVKEQSNNCDLHLVVAKVYEKVEQYDKALQAYLAANALAPKNEAIQTNMAWALIRFVKEILKESTDDSKFEQWIAYGLSLLPRFTELTKTSSGYSQLMRALTKAVKSYGKKVPWRVANNYVWFVKTWGIDHFSQSDYLPFIPEKSKVVYPSLVENVTTVLYHCVFAIEKEKNPPRGSMISVVGPSAPTLRSPLKDNLWVIDFIASSIAKFPRHPWFSYYYGKLLIEVGRNEEARPYILKKVQQKSMEFWTWQVLSETYPTDSKERLACLCRALQCNVNEKEYLNNVRKTLREELRLKGALLVEDEDGNCEYYKEMASLANEIVLENMPIKEAVITARYFDCEENASLVKVWWQACQGEARIKIKTSSWLEDVEPGTPVRAWVNVVDGVERVLKIEPRTKGSRWDIYPKKIAALVYRDERRGQSQLVIDEDGNTCLADWEKFPAIKDVSEGSLCELVLLSLKNKTRLLLDCKFVDNVERPSFVTDYAGEIQIPDGRKFGFVNETIFVPQKLIEGLRISCGAKVQGIAVCALDKVKQKTGWKAVTLAMER